MNIAMANRRSSGGTGLTAVQCAMEFANSAALRAHMAEITGHRTLLGMSGGKDSIAAWIALREDGFETYPYFLYIVPGLEFVEDNLAYLEQQFEVRIARFPHPAFWRMLQNGVFQTTAHAVALAETPLPKYDYSDVDAILREQRGWPDSVFRAVGLRACDSLSRRTLLKQSGPINTRKGAWYPVYDWTIARVRAAISSAGIRLGMEYDLFGRSFDGLQAAFLIPVKARYPRDYARILEFFPLAELEVWRYENQYTAEERTGGDGQERATGYREHK